LINLFDLKLDIRNKGKKIRFLSFNELKNFKKIKKDPRDDLIISILYDTGCTVNELVNIRNSHFDFRNNMLKIRREHARNQESRSVYISDVLIQKIREFQKINPDSEYIFYSRQSKSMTTKRIRQIVQKYFKKAGIVGAGPQVLRYTHIVHAYKKNIPLDAIQNQVGLKRSRAIEIFAQLPEIQTKDAYKKFTE